MQRLQGWQGWQRRTLSSRASQYGSKRLAVGRQEHVQADCRPKMQDFLGLEARVLPSCLLDHLLTFVGVGPGLEGRSQGACCCRR